MTTPPTATQAPTAPETTDPATAPHAAPGSPLTPGAIQGPNGEQGYIMSEAEFLAQDVMKEDHTLHIGVLVVGTLLALLLSGAGAVGTAGVFGAIAACIGTIVMLAIAIPVNTCVGWFVGKIFGEDFGAFPILLLRFGAVTALFTALMTGANMTIGPLMGFILVMPLLLALTVWLIGMDIFQALVYSIALNMLQWLLAAFVMLTVASLMAIGGSSLDMADMEAEMWEEYGESGEYFDEYGEYDEDGEFQGDYYEDAEYYEDW